MATQHPSNKIPPTSFPPAVEDPAAHGTATSQSQTFQSSLYFGGSPDSPGNPFSFVSRGQATFEMPSATSFQGPPPVPHPHPTAGQPPAPTPCLDPNPPTFIHHNQPPGGPFESSLPGHLPGTSVLPSGPAMPSHTLLANEPTAGIPENGQPMDGSWVWVNGRHQLPQVDHPAQNAPQSLENNPDSGEMSGHSVPTSQMQAFAAAKDTEPPVVPPPPPTQPYAGDANYAGVHASITKPGQIETVSSESDPFHGEASVVKPSSTVVGSHDPSSPPFPPSLGKEMLQTMVSSEPPHHSHGRVSSGELNSDSAHVLAQPQPILPDKFQRHLAEENPLPQSCAESKPSVLSDNLGHPHHHSSSSLVPKGNLQVSHGLAANDGRMVEDISPEVHQDLTAMLRPDVDPPNPTVCTGEAKEEVTAGQLLDLARSASDGGSYSQPSSLVMADKQLPHEHITRSKSVPIAHLPGSSVASERPQIQLAEESHSAVTSPAPVAFSSHSGSNISTGANSPLLHGAAVTAAVPHPLSHPSIVQDALNSAAVKLSGGFQGKATAHPYRFTNADIPPDSLAAGLPQATASTNVSWYPKSNAMKDQQQQLPDLGNYALGQQSLESSSQLSLPASGASDLSGPPSMTHPMQVPLTSPPLSPPLCRASRSVPLDTRAGTDPKSGLPFSERSHVTSLLDNAADVNLSASCKLLPPTPTELTPPSGTTKNAPAAGSSSPKQSDQGKIQGPHHNPKLDSDGSFPPLQVTTNLGPKAASGMVQTAHPSTGASMTTTTPSSSSGYGESLDGVQKLDSKSSMAVLDSQSMPALNSQPTSSHDVGLSSRVTTGMEEPGHALFPTVASAPILAPPPSSSSSVPATFHPPQPFAPPPLIPSQLGCMATEPTSFPSKPPSLQRVDVMMSRGVRTNADIHLQNSVEEDSPPGSHLPPPTSKPNPAESLPPPASSHESLSEAVVAASIHARPQLEHEKVGERERDRSLDRRPLERDRRDYYHHNRAWDYDHPRDDSYYEGYGSSHDYYDRAPPHSYHGRHGYRPHSTLPYDAYDHYYNTGYQDQYGQHYWDDPHYHRPYHQWDDPHYHGYSQQGRTDREYYESYERNHFYQQRGYYPPHFRDRDRGHHRGYHHEDPYYHDGYHYDHPPPPPHGYEVEQPPTSMQPDFHHQPPQQEEELHHRQHSDHLNQLSTEEGPDASIIRGQPNRLDLSPNYGSPSISYPPHHARYDQQEPPRESTLIEWQGYPHHQDGYGYPPSQGYPGEERDYDERVDVGPRYPTVGGADDEEQVQQPFIPIRELPQSPERETPIPFAHPHVSVSFGINGQLVTVLPVKPSAHVSAVVQIHCIQSLIPEAADLAQRVSKIPGPLIQGETPKSAVVKFASQKAEQCSSVSDDTDSADQNRSSSDAILWKFLVLLCKQNGIVLPSDISELLMQEPSPLRVISPGGIVVGRNGRNDDESLEEMRQLLLSGRKKDALDLACGRALWGHALMLASCMEDQSRTYVVNRFTASLSSTDPLSTFYTMLLGRTPSIVRPEGLARAGSWQSHLAMMISNRSSEQDNMSIVCLGDNLLRRGQLCAAHLCYHLAGLQLGSYGDIECKYSLLGEDQRRIPVGVCPEPEQLSRTEVYEYAMSLSKPDFVLPAFQIFKMLYVFRLVEAGLITKALRYCESISSYVLRCVHSYNPTFVAILLELSSRLHYASCPLGVMETDLPSWVLQLEQVTVDAQSTTRTSAAESSRASPTPSSASQPIPGRYTMNENTQHNYPPPAATGQYDHVFPAGMAQPGAMVATTSSDVVPAASTWPSQPFSYSHQQVRQEGGISQGQGGELVRLDVKDQPASLMLTYPATEGDGVAPSDLSSQRDDSHFQSGPPNVVQQDRTAFASYYQQTDGAEHSVPLPVSQGYSEAPAPLEMASYPGAASSYQAQETATLAPPYFPTQPQPTGGHSQNEQEEEEAKKASGDMDKPEDGEKKKKSTKSKQEPASGGGFLSIFTRWIPAKPNQAHLPDDKDPRIVWDKEKNKWIDLDADEEEESGPTAPPTDSELKGIAGTSASFPAAGTSTTNGSQPLSTGNPYQAARTGKFRKSFQYVDVLNPNKTRPSGSQSTTAPVPVAGLDSGPGSLAPLGQANPFSGSFFVPQPAGAEETSFEAVFNNYEGSGTVGQPALDPQQQQQPAAEPSRTTTITPQQPAIHGGMTADPGPHQKQQQDQPSLPEHTSHQAPPSGSQQTYPSQAGSQGSTQQQPTYYPGNQPLPTQQQQVQQQAQVSYNPPPASSHLQTSHHRSSPSSHHQQTVRPLSGQNLETEQSVTQPPIQPQFFNPSAFATSMSSMPHSVSMAPSGNHQQKQQDNFPDNVSEVSEFSQEVSRINRQAASQYRRPPRLHQRARPQYPYGSSTQSSGHSMYTGQAPPPPGSSSAAGVGRWN